MGIGYYVIVSFIILFSLITLLYKLYNISVQGKNDLLERMFNSNDISSNIYKKYKKEINE